MRQLLMISIILVIVGCGLILVNFVLPHMVSVEEAVQVPYTVRVPVTAGLGSESGDNFLQQPSQAISNAPPPAPSVKLYQAEGTLTWRETHVTGYTNETQYRTEYVSKEANSNLYLYSGSCIIGVGVVLIIACNTLFKRRTENLTSTT